jgi:hypothetical protein
VDDYFGNMLAGSDTALDAGLPALRILISPTLRVVQQQIEARRISMIIESNSAVRDVDVFRERPPK